MSNEVVLSLDALKQQLAAMPSMSIDEETKLVAGSGGGKRISIKGGVFRKYVNGKEVATVADRHMHVIFVKIAPTPSRQYYPEAFEDGKKVAPLCWSGDTVTPDKSIEKPQAASCKACPMDIKGSAREGDGRACRFSWRTAVVLPSDPEGDVMQLIIPGKSVWGDEYNGGRPFKTYVRYLADNNISAGRLITKMEFDLRHPSPVLLFSPVGVVPVEILPKLEEQNKSQSAELAVAMTMFHTDVAAEEAPVVAAPQLAAPAAVPAFATPHTTPTSAYVTPLVDISDKEPPFEAPKAAAVPAPTLREDAKQAPDVPPVQNTAKPEVSDIIKRWAKKA